jgi:pimeloyl-ACP methyl ester carboxylesterase
LIIQGRQGFLGGSTAFTIYQTIPGCKIEFIEKCGHFPFIEKPDDFFQALEAFLEK